jgi:hypothetical protein
MSLKDHLAELRRVVYGEEHVPDQYASHQNDKERALSLVNELHGVAAQIKRAQEDETHLQYHPMEGRPTIKEISRQREGGGLQKHQKYWMDRLMDWTGIRRYIYHSQYGEDDGDEVDKFDYFRQEASKVKPVEYEDVAEAGEAEEATKRHAHNYRAQLEQLRQRFINWTHHVEEQIKSRLAKPFKASHKTKDEEEEGQATTEIQTATTTTEVRHPQGEGEDSSASEMDNVTIPVIFLPPPPDHPLLDPLHSILRDVESMATRPLLPPPPTSLWQRFMAVLFPPRLEYNSHRAYAKAREEVRHEAMKLSETLRHQYEILKQQLSEIKEDVVEGKGEPLELYEQYNPEPVHLDEQEQGEGEH